MNAAIWTADYVYTDRPRAGYALVVDGQQVVDLGPLEAVQKRYPSLSLEPQGRYLGPPLVNAHTHLDLGLLPTFKGPFDEFLSYVISHSAERGLAAARQALPEVKQRVVGSIATSDEELVSWLLAEADLEGVVYWEVLGLLPPAAERELVEKTRRLVRRWKKLERPGGMRLGLSPHATYSLGPGLMKSLVELAAAEGLQLQIHAAESPAESEYFASRSGPIADFYRSRGLPLDLHPTGLSPIEYLADLGVLDARPTLVHGVQVSETDVQLMSSAGVTLVSCPRSNVNLEAGLPPYGLYRASGITIALGTDSRASAESLDVRDEIDFLASRSIDGDWLLNAAVAGGYRALGFEPPRITRGVEIGLVESW